jgi:hypothetical protein
MVSSSRCKWCEYPYEPPGWVPEARDGILTEPIKIDADGYVSVPRKPGLGLSIDEDKLKKYGEKIFSIRGFWGVVVLFGIVMGGIYGGIFTPTEAAAVGTFFAFLLASAKRRLNWASIIAGFRDTLRITGMIFRRK